MTFTAVVTSHDNPEGLRYILQNLRAQTRTPDEIRVFASGTPLTELRSVRGAGTYLSLEPDLNDWGHAKRARGLELCETDYVGFFNDDDSYDLRYIEVMMLIAEELDVDVVYCDWSGVPNCSFSLGSSTSGNYIVRTELARAVGYTDRHYEADGTFIEKLREQAKRGVTKVHELLYFHNVQ